MLLSKDLIIGCFQSWYDITRFIIFKKKKSVIFATPQHFNRAENGKNPYIEKLISTCKDQNIPFLQLESPEYEAPQPRDPNAIRIDLIFWLMMLLNKIAIRIYGKSNRNATRAVAIFINCITLGKLRVSCYITMAGLFIEMFQEMSPNATVYDLQHGIIYAGHPGYFDSNGNISASLSAPNCKILLWGDGFKDLFVNSTENDINDPKVRVIGYPIEERPNLNLNNDRKTIIFSLQFTNDVEHYTLLRLKEMLDEALSVIDTSTYIVKLKHHPRYNNVIDLSDIIKKHPQIVFTDEPLKNLVSDSILNITWYSTTCFEFAAYGIPTAILSDSHFILGTEIYYTQFKYPVFKGLSLSEIMVLLNDHTQMKVIGKSVRSWYSRLYAPFNPEAVKSILNIR